MHGTLIGPSLPAERLPLGPLPLVARPSAGNPERVDSDLPIRYIRGRSAYKAKATVSSIMSVMRGMGEFLVRRGVWLRSVRSSVPCQASAAPSMFTLPNILTALPVPSDWMTIPTPAGTPTREVEQPRPQY